jgi:hypothetical protein
LPVRENWGFEFPMMFTIQQRKPEFQRERDVTDMNR